MLQKKRNWHESIHESSEICVPLKQLNIDATIRSFAANVTITQKFRNDENVPIEAVYCFPIEEQAAVWSFVARIADREIVAQLKEKKQAQQEYDDALQEHHGAYMLEQNEDSQDNFIINVGALPPNEECYITISYVTELDLVQNGTEIRFVIPTTIAPRYNSNRGAIDSPANTKIEYVQSAPYTIQFYCSVERYGISRVSCISHPIQINFNQKDVYQIEFAQKNTHLDRDIIMAFELDENRSNTIIAVESSVIMASFTPNEQDCRRIINNGNITNEFIFIVDCSGSMSNENKIELARQAMLLFLKNLPVACHFNIIRFGSDYKSLFNGITTIYNEDNVRQAEQFINNMTADLGGTELLPPLNWLKQNSPIQGHFRQVFLLSDGEISNIDEVLNLCRSMAVSTRIFSFGLGHAPSRSLIKGLARATNGRFVFIPPDTYVDVYVGEQLQKALQPCITNVQIKLNLDPTFLSIVPTSSPPVFINDRLIVYAILNSDNNLISFDHDICLELYSEQYRLCKAKVNRIPNVVNDGMIARLAAKALILELQHSKLPSSNKNDLTESMREKIIEISLKYNILSSYTAFVGIEKRVNTNNANMVLREVPIQILADNQYLKYLQTPMSPLSHRQCEQRQLYYGVSCMIKKPKQRVLHVSCSIKEPEEYASALCHYPELRQEQCTKSCIDFGEAPVKLTATVMEYDHGDQLRRHFSDVLYSSPKHYEDFGRRFVDPCDDYDHAREQLTIALMKYDDVQHHWDSTDTDRNEAKGNLDRVRDKYEEARNRLVDARMEYEKSQQNFDYNRVKRDRTPHYLNRTFSNYHHDQHNFDHIHRLYTEALNIYSNVQHDFHSVINHYKRAQERYDDMIQSINENYQNQKESSQGKGQQLSQKYENKINSVNTLFQSAHKARQDYENQMESIECHLEEIHQELRISMDKIHESDMRLTHMQYEEEQETLDKIRHVEKLLRQQREKNSSRKSQMNVRNDNQEDLDIVRHIIAQQKFDGLWNIDVNFIKQLTGKSFRQFKPLTNTEMLISAIIIVVLETRFASLVSMWYGVVQKARQRLLDMLDKDINQFTILLEDIQKQL